MIRLGLANVRLAWRDSRGNRRRLLSLVAAMSLGVAALVAIGSFAANLQRAFRSQANALLGADLRLRWDEPLEPADEELVAAICAETGGVPARQIAFPSMALFARAGVPRLVRVRAIEDAYPFYGEIGTEPAEAAARFRAAARDGAAVALVEKTLLLELGAQPGDTVHIGKREYEVIGALLVAPGESATGALFGPRIYVPLAALDRDLLGRGSRSSHDVYLRLPPDVDVERLEKRWEARCEERDVRVMTAASREESWGDALARLRGFLNLTAVVALLLGGIGVGSTMHVYAREKVDATALLRCLGASPRFAVSIYVLQAAAFGAVASLAGAAIGIVVQRLLPILLRGFLPVAVPTDVAWTPVVIGTVTGVVTAVAFAVIPLAALRRVPPLAALLSSYELVVPKRDPLRLGMIALILLGTTSFTWYQTGDVRLALGFPAALCALAAVLAGLARLLIAALKRVSPRHLPYVWRQGIANLHRPHNQTGLLTLTLGLSACLVLTVLLARGRLLREIEMLADRDQPNVVLFDVQDDQREPVAQLVQSLGLPVREQVPIVSMRLKSVNGRTVSELRKDRRSRIPTWTLTREYRSTYRRNLVATEQVVAGEWVSDATSTEGPVPVSVEEELARRLRVRLGDRLEFDVAGSTIEVSVASLREVDWRRVQPNFFVVFPAGVLEQAPKFHVLVTRSESAERTAELERALVQQFPGVSAIDIGQVLALAERLFDQIAIAVQVMASFSILAGVLVAWNALRVTRAQRFEEGALLRALGATRRQVQRIAALEHAVLFAVGTASGALLALAISAIPGDVLIGG